ncbi:MAG TPA: glycogen/starch/alpha-glucan phosphorylase, partial [Candidatus Cloacimonadota bacterium]|nr:glycogen/starch/alpha-glucan phosphorylase [Candidatus Cloacimonadota bacterium]
LKSDEVSNLKARGYNPVSYYQNDPLLKRVVDSLLDDTWCTDESGLFAPIWKALMEDGDQYLHMADFRAFVEASERVDSLYKDRDEWVKKAIINIARVGKFSSDRAIRQYAEDIWKIKPLQLDFGG